MEHRNNEIDIKEKRKKDETERKKKGKRKKERKKEKAAKLRNINILWKTMVAGWYKYSLCSNESALLYEQT